MRSFLKLFTEPRPQSIGRLSGGRWVVCCLCILGILLPTASLLPIRWLQSIGLQSEEEVETGEDTECEAMEERRLSAPPPRFRMSPPHRQTSARLDLRDRATTDRSEFRSLNGTGARLRC